MRGILVAGLALVLVVGSVGTLEARAPTRELVYHTSFDGGLPAGWTTYDSRRVRMANVSIANGMATLTVRPYGDEWRGGGLRFSRRFTYGTFVARIRIEPAHHTKGLAMLWPVAPWPPEIDFLEVGETDWTRQRNTLTAHYDPDDKMIHRSYYVDLTKWHTIAVDWRPDHLTFRCDGKVMPNTWGVGLDSRIANPGINEQMMLRLAYWPTHKQPRDAWPGAVSKMYVQWVSIYA